VDGEALLSAPAQPDRANKKTTPHQSHELVRRLGMMIVDPV
jgi:hypothetical protein